ncbi:MAG: hypothetical protein ACRENP_22585 [Longimicrobiales bacterium]
MRTRLLTMISISVLAAPLGVHSQVPEYERMPRGFNKHAISVDASDVCPAGGRTNADLQRRMNRIDPIPTYGWVWVTLDAIRKLDWPRAANRVDRFSWDAILTPAQRDSVRAYEGTPVAVDGFLMVDNRRRLPVIAAGLLDKASTNCGRRGGEQEDWHFLLTRNQTETRTDAIVVTVTPQMRQAGWNLAKLDEIARRGVMVRIWGWLLFDQEHPEQIMVRSKRTKGRVTPWVVHPIVEIEVFQDMQTLVPLKDWGNRRR